MARRFDSDDDLIESPLTPLMSPPPDSELDDDSSSSDDEETPIEFLWPSIHPDTPPITRAFINEHFTNAVHTLQNIIFPSKVTTIATGCFKGFSALKYVEFTGHEIHIEPEAFMNCSNLSHVFFPVDGELTEDETFDDLMSVTYNTTIKRKAFAGTSIQTFYVPSNAIELDRSIFANCDELKFLRIGPCFQLTTKNKIHKLVNIHCTVSFYNVESRENFVTAVWDDRKEHSPAETGFWDNTFNWPPKTLDTSKIPKVQRSCNK